MKLPRISNNRLKSLDTLHTALRRVFIVGTPLGVGILLLGTIAAQLHDPQRFGNEVPPRVAAIAEVVLALAGAVLAVAFLLEGYVYACNSARSTRYAINALLTSAFASVLLGSIAVVLTVMAVRDWMSP